MKDSKLAIILALIALVGVLTISFLWAFGSLKLGVVQLDTFIGVIVALLAIIVTIILGWQIVNAMEMRGKISNLENTQKSTVDVIAGLNSNLKETVKLTQSIQSIQNMTSGQISYDRGEFVEAFAFYHMALYNAIMSGQQSTDNIITILHNTCSSIVIPPRMGFAQVLNPIRSTSDMIRQTEAYRLHLSLSYEQIMTQFWGKMRELGLLEAGGNNS